MRVPCSSSGVFIHQCCPVSLSTISASDFHNNASHSSHKIALPRNGAKTGWSSGGWMYYISVDLMTPALGLVGPRCAAPPPAWSFPVRWALLADVRGRSKWWGNSGKSTYTHTFSFTYRVERDIELWLTCEHWWGKVGESMGTHGGTDGDEQQDPTDGEKPRWVTKKEMTENRNWQN